MRLTYVLATLAITAALATPALAQDYVTNGARHGARRGAATGDSVGGAVGGFVGGVTGAAVGTAVGVTRAVTSPFRPHRSRYRYDRHHRRY